MLNKETLLGGHGRGLLFVLSAPAGTGKTTLVNRIVQNFPSVVQSISFTTRAKRPLEKDGDHYSFVSVKEFEERIAAGEFLEYVKLYDDYYGTSKKWVDAKLQEGKHVVLVIDMQGALQLMDSLDAAFIFLKPPSIEVLKERLVSRNTETPESLAKRLSWAEKEMDAAHYYDYQVVNDDLDTAYQILLSIFIAEEHRTPSEPKEYS